MARGVPACRWLWVALVLWGAGLASCQLADRVGPYTLTTVAAHERDLNGTPADWVELCNRGTRPRPLDGWSLRAVTGGQEVLVHLFEDGTRLRAESRTLLGPEALSPGIRTTLDLPEGPQGVVLRLYDAERNLVDQMFYVSGATGELATRRRCDCVSNGADPDDVVTLPRAAFTPGTEPSPRCVDGASSGASGSSSSSSSGGGGADGGGTNACVAAGCHTWFPVTVEAGRTWRFALEGGNAADVQELTPQGAGPTPGTFVVRVVSTVDGAVTTQTSTYRCTDDLLEQLSTNVVSTGVSSTSTFTPPLRVLEAGMAVGSTFSQSVVARIVAQTPVGPVDRTVNVEQTVAVQAVEALSAGPQPANSYRVVQNATLDGTPQQVTTWYAPGEGVVKQVSPPLPGQTGGARTWLRSQCE